MEITVCGKLRLINYIRFCYYQIFHKISIIWWLIPLLPLINFNYAIKKEYFLFAISFLTAITILLIISLLYVLYASISFLKSGFWGYQKYEFNEDFIKIDNKRGSNEMSWNSIKEIVFGSQIYLFTSRIAALIVPRSWFPINELEKLKSLLYKKEIPVVNLH